MEEKRRNGYRNICKRSKGFTLVELIVVLVIIAILAALAVPAMLGFIDSTHKKQVIARAQTALTSTQAALSDIYTGNDNEYTVEKRIQTRLNAGSTEDDGTKFTVWSVKPLFDEREGDRESTIAITEEIGSYTVAQAIYKDDEYAYAAYDGSDWEVYETEDEAQLALSVSESDENVIFVWPYTDYSDTARKPSGPSKPDPDDPGPDEPAVAEVKTVILKGAEKGRAFFKEPGSDSEAQSEIRISFSKDDLDIVISDWTWNEADTISFTKAAEKLVLGLAKTYLFRYWQEEGTDYTAEKINTIQSYIFNDDNADRTEFTFVACVLRDPNVKEQATLDNTPGKRLFNNFLNRKNVEAMVQVIDEEHEEDYFKNTLKATRVDDGSNNPYVIYAWMDGTTLKWWTNALVAFLPQDCSELCGGDNKGNVKYISFAGFDAAKMTTAVGMFKKSGIQSLDFGEFVAPKLTDMSECFKNCGSLVTLDLSSIQEVGPQMKLTAVCREMGSLVTASFGPAFQRTSIVGSLEYMFNQDKNLVRVDMPNWNVTEVTTMAYAFVMCKPGDSAEYVQNKIEYINFGDNGWDLASCESLLYTFYGCGKNREHADAIVDFSKIKTSNKLTNIAEAFKCVDYAEIDLNNINVENVTNMRSAFYKCKNLVKLDIDKWRPLKVENMMETFRECSSLEYIDLSKWDLSNLEVLYRTFRDCKKIHVDIAGMKGPSTGKLRSVAEAFMNCEAMNGTMDLSQWNMTGLNGKFTLDNNGEYNNQSWYNVDSDIGDMFNNCKSLEGLILKGWDLSNAKQVNNFMGGCNALKVLDLSGVRVKQVSGAGALFGAGKSNLEKVLYKGARIDAVVNLNGMLKDAKKLVIVDMTEFEAPNATGAKEMFANCELLNEDLRIKDMHLNSATSAESMFNGCKVLESIDMSGCMLGSLTSTKNMFKSCPVLAKVILKGTDFSLVEDMSYMFNGCSRLETIDMSGCNFNSLKDMNNAFNGCSVLKNIDLSGMNTQKVTNMASLFNGCSSLETVNLSGMKTPEVTNMSYMFNNCNKLKEVDVLGFDTSNVTNMENMFNNCKNIKELRLADWNIERVTKNGNMLTNMESLEYLDISGWKFSGTVLSNSFLNGSRSKLKTLIMNKVDLGATKNLDAVFKDCTKLEKIEMSECKMQSVTKISSMFYNCKMLKNIDMSSCDFNSLTDMNNAFNRCEVIKSVDLSGINTENVTDLISMFKYCYALTEVKFEGWDTSSVTRMEQMFNGCKAIESIDISEFNTISVTECKNMFYDCSALVTIYAGRDTDFTNVSSGSSTDMFKNCNKLIGGAGTKYNGNHTKKEYAHIDGGIDNPGYFTAK